LIFKTDRLKTVYFLRGGLLAPRRPTSDDGGRLAIALHARLATRIMSEEDEVRSPVLLVIFFVVYMSDRP
jgi:hypothetical protein